MWKRPFRRLWKCHRCQLVVSSIIHLDAQLTSRAHLNTHAPFVAKGGYYREEAIMLLRRFYMSENPTGEPLEENMHGTKS